MDESGQQQEPVDGVEQEDASPGGAPQAETMQSEEVESQPYADHRVLSLLFDTRVPVGKYIIRAGVLSLVPSLAIAFILSLIGLGGEQALPQFEREAGPVFLFVLMVIVGPALETLFLGLGLWLLSFVLRDPVRKALGSCAIWAALHSSQALLWGPVVVWPFFVFSCAYLAWRRKSRWHALGVACGIHMFQNFLPGVLIAAGLPTSG